MTTTKVSIGSGGDAELFSKKASFIQHSLPGLQAGAYQIKVQQELRDSSGKLITVAEDGNNPAPLDSITRQLGVKGPKYSLNANVVQSVYPPVSSVGGFSNALAHVVLTQEKLPWLRSPYLPQNIVTPGEHEYPANGTTIYYDDDQPTWMMVLTISPGDLGGQDPASLITRGTVLDLVPESLKMNDKSGTPIAGTLPSNGYSIFSYLLQPPVATQPVSPEFGNTSADPCTYIDMPAALFNKLVPSLEDLKMMAHVRAVEMDAKPLKQDETVPPVEQYGLVLGNRLPETFTGTGGSDDPQTITAQGNNTAFLISLESMELALRGNTASQNQYPVITANGGFVRLVVLNQWSFTSWASKSYQFEQILKGLNGRDPNADNSTVPLSNPLLRLPDPPQFKSPTQQQTIVQEMIELGYTPMNHLARVPSGSNPPVIQTVSWYRGPLVPFSREATIRFISGNQDTQAEMVYSADKLLRFDPRVGMYDTSYAAAWQLGQLTALQNKAFSVAYFRWQKGNAQKFRVLLENELLADDHPSLMAFSRSLAGEENRAETQKPIYQSVLDLLTKKD